MSALARAYAVVRSKAVLRAKSMRVRLHDVFALAEPRQLKQSRRLARPADAQRETILVVDDEAGIRT